MSCPDCNSSLPNTVTLSYSTSNTCAEDNGCSINLSSACVFFNAPNLACTGIVTGDSIELALQKMDQVICQSAGDYSTYNFHCLDDVTAITTEAQFVSAITDYICTLNTSLSNFTGTTFVNYQTNVDNRFKAVETPGITCTSASITSTDSLVTVLNKYCTKFGALDTSLNLSGVVWNSCYTVVSAPTTIAEGFSLLADQICQTKALVTSAGLPTFNNSASCLSINGSADTLVNTVEAIKTRLCQSPTLDNSTLTSTCISIPATSTDLQTLLQNVLTKVDSLSTNIPTFNSGDFVVTGTGCGGKTVALATPINQDRLVAANASDSSPSTLINKLVGVGCTIDDTTNAGKITLTVSASSTSDGKVKADSADAASDYLINKMGAGSSASGIGLSVGYDATNDKIQISPSLDSEVLLNTLLTYLEENPDSTIAKRLCSIISNCPSPCDGPTNVQAVALSGTTSTSTTTTSTTSSTTTTTTTV